MIGLVDTHCHLDASYYPEGCQVALDRARAEGVVAFVAIGVGQDTTAASQALAAADAFPDVWAAIGLHPHDASFGTEQLLGTLEDLARHPRVVAFGEIGLDHHYMHSSKEDQARVFREGVGIARRLGKPIVVHTREAPEETLRILAEEHAGEVGGVIHCFSEDRPFAERALDLGFDLSFSGIVTFKNAKAIHDVAAWAPLDRVLVETDSPYLAPIPHRGKTNEPSFVIHTARRVAELRGIALEELAAATTANARRRFGLG